jgi:ketosteroid isomerase-like protein
MEAEKPIADFFEFFNRRDLDRMKSLLAEKARFYFPKTQPLLGLDRILKFLRLLFRQYPELTFTLHRTIVQGNQGAVHWTNRGKNRRGELYENEGVTLLEFEGEKISFISDFFKDTEKF